MQNSTSQNFADFCIKSLPNTTKAACINVRELVITFSNNCVIDSLESFEPEKKNKFYSKNCIKLGKSLAVDRMEKFFEI